MKSLGRFAILAALTFAPRAEAVECRDKVFEDTSYTICEIDATKEDLRLFLRSSDGTILGHFRTIENSLPTSQTLIFAMNAGMYHADRSPVGLYIEQDKTEGRLLTGASSGNFGLLPNGVFCIREGRADVIETLAFERAGPDCTYATQSGPMLVIDGALHPRFLKDSTSKHIRNGVGTSTDGKRAVFAISNAPVRFHTFGRLFRDVLETPNALYFDGKVSRLHAPATGRSDAGFWLGPIVGVVGTK